MSTPQEPSPPGRAYDPFDGRDPYNNRGFDIPYPAGTRGAEQPTPARPRSMTGALVLQIVGSLPWLLIGLGLLVAPVTADEISSSGVLAAPQVAAAGITAENLISVLRGFGVLFVVVPLIYVALAVVAFTGRNWARVAVTVLTVVFLLLLVVGLVGGGGAAGGGTGLVVVFGLVPAIGVALMFTAAANAWFTSLRR